MSDIAVTLSLPASATAPYAARHGVVDGLRLDGQVAACAALLVSEAVTNSVLHAGLGPADRVHVEAWWSGGCVHVEVCDEGAGMRTPSGAGPREGGRGLKLIDGLAAQWGVHSDGFTRIWFDIAG